MNDSVRVVAHAKVNLRLSVTAREASGYHQIETLFCLLELADEVEVSLAADGVSLDVANETAGRNVPDDLGPPDGNLAVRAAREFIRAAGVQEGATIRLVKRIPAGAGLGGGSSDAAAVLRALNALHGAPLDTAALLPIGAALGSDVPFFVCNTPLALAWGRGGRLLPLPPLPPRPVLLAVPPWGVNTGEAYAALAADRAGGFRAERPALLSAPAGWADIAADAPNDFEAVIFPRHPRLAELRYALETSGAVVARMTGSGSVVFGVFEDERTADAAVRKLETAFADTRWIVTRTVG